MVITDVNQVVYLGNGSRTAFPFTFRIIDATDVKLLLIDADGTETDITADYFVDTVNSTVHYPGYAPGAEPSEADQPAPVQEGQRLVVYRELPVTQEKDLGEKWPFFEIELALDKLTMLIQGISGIWNRCLRVTVGQAATHPDFDYNIPIETGKTFRVKDDGTGFELTEDPKAAREAAEAAQAAAVEAQGKAEDAKDAAEEASDNAEAALDLIKEKATWFNNVAAMKAAAGLQVGMLAGTKGYYSINDGGSSIYAIRVKTQDDVDDGGSIIILDNGNVAELITEGIVNVKQFGVVCDGVEDDAIQLQKAITFADFVDLQGLDCLINTAITLKSDLTIKNGTLTIGADGTYISATSASNIKLENVDIVYTTDTYDTGGYGQVLFTDCDNIKVIGGTYDAKAQRCITFLTCTNVIVDNVTSTNVKGTAITFNGGKNLNVVNCVFDSVDKTNQTAGKHMLDIYGKAADVVGATVFNSTFANHKSNGLQFTSTPGSRTIIDAIVDNCTFRDYGDAGLKVDGVDDLVTISNNTFYNGSQGVSLSGASGTADKTIISGCSFLNLTDYLVGVNLSLNVAGTPNFSSLKFVNNNIINCERTVRLPAAYFGSVLIEGNYFNNSMVGIFRTSPTAEADSYIFDKNYIKNQKNTVSVTPGRTKYISVCGNCFYKPAATSTGNRILFNINGMSDYIPIARVENNTFIEANGVSRFNAVNKFKEIRFNGNTVDGVEASFYTTPDTENDVRYAKQPVLIFATSAPSEGSHYRGEIVWNSTPTQGGTIGWSCVVGGTPGTWKAFGAIEA